MRPSILFVSGLLFMAYGVAALFFLRFWRESRDRLFAFFSAAFTLQMVQVIAYVRFPGTVDETAWMYLLRLAGFVLIIIGIVDKNRARR